MKKKFAFIFSLAVFGFIFGWIYVVRSESYNSGVAWIKSNCEVYRRLGLVNHAYPDLGRYKANSSSGIGRVRFSIFAHGEKGWGKVGLVLQRVDRKWVVIKAVIDGDIIPLSGCVKA